MKCSALRFSSVELSSAPLRSVPFRWQYFWHAVKMWDVDTDRDTLQGGETINVFLQLPKEEAADGDKDADVVLVLVVVV